MKKLLLLITIMISTLPQFCLAQDCSVSIDGPSTIFCPDESITLTAQTQGFDDANTTFLWFANDYPGNQIADTGTDTTLNVQPPYTQTTTTFWVSASGTCQGSSYTTTDSLTVTVFSNFQLTGVAPAQAAICAGETISITATAIPNTNLTYTWAGPNGFALTNQTNATLTRNNATPNMSGTYTVTVTGQGGCFQTASTTITVYPQPAVNATAADNTVCPTQQNLQLQATGSGGTEPYIFEWSGPNGFNNNTQNPAINNMPANAAGNYTVTLTDDNDCTATGSFLVTANSLPTANITVTETSGIANNDGTVCAGASAALTATGAGTGGAYSWSNGLATAAITVNPTANTTYTVTV
ncbi:hypothetical protein C7N43_39570, partial [Sphingobacteriales bacterium UPWRP_1]